jgi:hypothetical protein
MRPVPGEVLHFSEDPAIAEFAPHVAATAQVPDPYVWAVDAEHAPSYWFPRNCPRMMAWPGPQTTADDRVRILGPGCGDRVHAIEYGWLERMRVVELYAYRFRGVDFRPLGEPRPHAMVASVPVRPLGPPAPVGDLFAVHAGAGIQLRVLPNLWEFVDAVVASTMNFSGIRLGNAEARRT